MIACAQAPGYINSNIRLVGGQLQILDWQNTIRARTAA
ncbi:hypothetical protein METH_02035 [Leisingera methylohalidivorans DSM 14336]|uniref:Uncharacterized protein n=1 Tax=Leisingera methylohalidivorans DSM 14336 TaxID=999552 RepID=V9VY22_9RHOB|nr:hypothetical protein METH_02035 [Leisingera methylohalidivorans DSM 14336]